MFIEYKSYNDKECFVYVVSFGRKEKMEIKSYYNFEFKEINTDAKIFLVSNYKDVLDISIKKKLFDLICSKVWKTLMDDIWVLMKTAMYVENDNLSFIQGVEYVAQNYDSDKIQAIDLNGTDNIESKSKFYPTSFL